MLIVTHLFVSKRTSNLCLGSQFLFKFRMSFLGRALGQLVSRFVTDKVANTEAMRQTAKVAVKGARSLKNGAKNVVVLVVYSH